MSRQWKRRVWGALVGLLAVPAAARAQEQGQTGTIAGRVTDAAAQQPIAGIAVVVVGTARGAVTSQTGEYRIVGVPAGTAQVRAQRIGYAPQTRPVTVTPGGTTTADFALTAAAVQLEQIVTTATGETERRREQPNAVSVVRPSTEQLAATNNVTDVLTARTPGVSVNVSGGTTGAGSRIRIRGASSVSLSNEPLLIIDGVRANNAVTSDPLTGSTTLGVGGQVPSRLNDINPEDIESIEVLKGPAASALYGTAAASGVIQITTKRGRAGQTRWQAYAEGGTIRDVQTYPANFARVGTLTTPPATGSARTAACTLDNEARGLCRPVADSVLSFSPLEQASPFRTGNLQNYGLSANGGTNDVSYYLAGDYQQENGVFGSSASRRVNLRANLRSQLRRNLDVAVSTGYLSSRLRFPQNDNNILGIISGGLLGRAVDDTVSRGYLAGQPPQELFAINTRQDSERFVTGVTTNYQPISWLNATVVGGLDFLNRYDNQLVPPGRVRFGALPEGSRTSNPYQIFNYTANGNLTATRDITEGLESSTSAGVQYTEELVRGTRASGAKLVAGTRSLSGTTARFEAREANTDNRTLGAYLRQQFAYRDRLFVTAAARSDRNSAFGQDFGFITYPSVGASYVISEEGFFPKVAALSSLQLRAAYGESGRQPNFRDAITFFEAQTVTSGATDVAGILVSGTGNVDLRPERSREVEFGLNAGMFGERLTLELTTYDKSTTDLLIARPLPPSLGLTESQFQNLGSTTNRGVEFAVSARLLPADQPFTADLTVTGNTNRNRLVTLGELSPGVPVPAIVFGRQQHRAGLPLGGYWQRPVSFEDLNGDGVISRTNCPGQTRVAGGPACEITVGDTSEYLGSPLPTREFSVQPRFGFRGIVSVAALVDYKGGHKLYNNTARFRCAFGNCREASDRTAPLAAQAANIGQLLGTDALYMEDASFTRLRELSVTLTAPKTLAERLQTSGMSLTLAGRNLRTWTDYTGFDPEVNSTPGANFSTSDFLTLPPTRNFTARLNVTF